MACFNAIDVVSRYPIGTASLRKRAVDAVQFLIQVWQLSGVARYTQLDNEACFSGGLTHPGVLGQVVRLGLLVGTELVFSPLRHPESNRTIERFHQEYSAHVWQGTRLADVEAVNQQAAWFFGAYRQSRHHTALQGQTPTQVHQTRPARRLPADFQLPVGKLPLTAGSVHFLRRVSADHMISLLNQTWAVPTAQVDQGVWATLELMAQRATLRIYDAAPSAPSRSCLAEHAFPVREAIQRYSATSRPSAVSRRVLGWLGDLIWAMIWRRAAA